MPPTEKLFVYSKFGSNLQTRNHYKNFFFALFVIILVSIITALSIQFWTFTSDARTKYQAVQLKNLRNPPRVVLKSGAYPSTPYNSKCSFWDCFNIYQCGRTGHDRISVYVYPLRQYLDENGSALSGVITQEFYQILDAIIKSKYYTANPEEACIYVPSLDTLNQEVLDKNKTSIILESLNFWSGGENHLLFNMISGTAPNFSPVIEANTGRAIIAGADFDTHSFRSGFDMFLPLYSPVARLGTIPHNSINIKTFLATSSQLAIDAYYAEELQHLSLSHPDLLILDECESHNYSVRCDVTTKDHYSYPKILQQSTFCFVFRGERMGQFVLLEAMAANCIPVVVIDSPVMPFNDVIDWKRAAIFVMEQYLNTVMDVLRDLSAERINEMRKQVKFLYDRYFSSLKTITETTLDILQDRVYPHLRKNYDDWNMRPDEIMKNPLFLPITAPRSQGFTAVILTYDRVESLFLLIRKLSKVPSLMKVLVVWNNLKKKPPPLENFPQINKPIKIIRTTANKLSNRFYPYEEIQTEAVLSIDDDIVMLTADELEFGYEVWREFPDRIVGFPSRTHIWDNLTNSWKYESEWTNEISMVLTGAAFMHKYWSYLYTTQMPSDVKDWVDEHMNCEDIAMNFLIANVTNKPPIKVTPRKKFKCPECVNNEMLSADLGHMMERSKCVDHFTTAFGRMPLISVEFRADPVLFKDIFPEKLKRFNDIGSL